MAGVYTISWPTTLSIYTTTGCAARGGLYTNCVILGSLHIHQEMVYTSHFLIVLWPKHGGGVYIWCPRKTSQGQLTPGTLYYKLQQKQGPEAGGTDLLSDQRQPRKWNMRTESLAYCQDCQISARSHCGSSNLGSKMDTKHHAGVN